MPLIESIAVHREPRRGSDIIPVMLSFSFADKHVFFRGITPPCTLVEGTNATDKRRCDVWNVGMDSSSERTEDGCSSQKSDSMDRSNSGKKPTPISYCPPSCLSVVLPSRAEMCSLFPVLRILAIFPRTSPGRPPSCRIWYVRANSSIELVALGHPLKGDKRPSRKSNSRHRSNCEWTLLTSPEVGAF